MKKYFYSSFGLNIESQLEFPTLFLCNSTSVPDLIIKEGKVPDVLDNSVEYKGNFQYTDNEFLFKSKNSGKFLVRNEDEVIFERYKQSTYEDIRVLLLSVVLGIVLHKKEKFPLHASAVEYNGRTILFSGQCGMGKSTIAAAFVKKGAKLVSDDITVIDTEEENFFAVPSFPQIKLWPDSLDALGFNPGEFEKFRPRLEKRKMTPDNIISTRAKIDSIFFIQRNNQNKTAIEELSAQDKIGLLSNNTFRIRHLQRIGNTKKHFETCCALAKSIPIRTINRPQNQFTLDRIIELVLENIHKN